MNKLTVRDWMSSDPITIHPQQTVPQARALMQSKNVRRLPVLEDEVLVGILTLGDIREAEPSDANTLSSYELDELVELMTVDSIMTSNPITIRETAPIAEAAQIIMEHKIGGLPVVDEEGGLIGIVTETDICRVVVEMFPVQSG